MGAQGGFSRSPVLELSCALEAKFVISWNEVLVLRGDDERTSQNIRFSKRYARSSVENI